MNDDETHQAILSYFNNNHADKLTRIAEEFYMTEMSYISDLKFIIENYFKEINSQQATRRFTDIFGNIMDVYLFNVSFFVKIQQNIFEAEKLSHVLIESQQGFIEIYGKYCVHYSDAIIKLKKYGENKCFNDIISKINDQHNILLPLSSFLLKPIQRLLKYPLLLNSMISVMESQGKPCTNTLSAHSGMEIVAEHINKLKQEHDDYNRYLHYQNLLADVNNLQIQHSGKYVTVETVQIRGADMNLLVFEKYIIIFHTQDLEVETKIIFQIRQLDIYNDVKKERTLIFDFDKLKLSFKFSTAKAAKNMFKTIIQLKNKIIDNLKNTVVDKNLQADTIRVELKQNRKDYKSRHIEHLKLVSPNRACPIRIKYEEHYIFSSPLKSKLINEKLTPPITTKSTNISTNQAYNGPLRYTGSRRNSIVNKDELTERFKSLRSGSNSSPSIYIHSLSKDQTPNISNEAIKIMKQTDTSARLSPSYNSQIPSPANYKNVNSVNASNKINNLLINTSNDPYNKVNTKGNKDNQNKTKKMKTRINNSPVHYKAKTNSVFYYPCDVNDTNYLSIPPSKIPKATPIASDIDHISRKKHKFENTVNSLNIYHRKLLDKINASGWPDSKDAKGCVFRSDDNKIKKKFFGASVKPRRNELLQTGQVISVDVTKKSPDKNGKNKSSPKSDIDTPDDDNLSTMFYDAEDHKEIEYS